MSSPIRNIQRTVKRTCGAPHYMGRGSRLGVSNPRAKDLLARQSRERVRVVVRQMMAA